MASVRLELGEYYLAQGDINTAGATHAHGLEIAQRNNYTDLAALNRFGLARVQAAQGNWAEARRLAQLSLTDLRAVGHHRADEVAGWLEALARAEGASATAGIPDRHNLLALQ